MLHQRRWNNKSPQKRTTKNEPHSPIISSIISFESDCLAGDVVSIFFNIDSSSFFLLVNVPSHVSLSPPLVLVSILVSLFSWQVYSGLGSFGCIHIIMGNKTSSEGGEGERGAKSGNSSYVGMDPALTGKRVSKFQSLRDHLKDDHKSVFEQHALKLHDSNVLRVYEIYQEKLLLSL